MSPDMSDDACPLPLTVDAITADWMTRALRTRVPGVACRRVDVVDVVRGTCTKIRLHLDVDDAGRQAGIPASVILKGGFEGHSRAMSLVHLAEVAGYRDIFPYIDLPVPACYFAGYDTAARQGIVIMEDLVGRGVTFCSALRPQSFEQTRDRLTVLARFHAQTWQSPDFHPGGRLAAMPESEPNLRAYMDQYLLKPDEWQRFVDAPRGAATSVAFHDLARITRAFDKLVTLSRQLPHCVLHGDTHLGNLYHYVDDRPGFLDSLPGRGPAMREISYHVACALDSGDRRRWEGALVQHYLGQLRAHGVDAPTFDQAMQHYAAFLLDGHVIFMVNESFYQPEAVNTAYTARFSAAMTDHRTLEVIDMLDGQRPHAAPADATAS